MSDSPSAALKRLGIAADPGGFESEEYLAGVLREALYEVVDYGHSQGVGACIAANQVPNVRLQEMYPSR